jgi:hypothetical protein
MVKDEERADALALGYSPDAAGIQRTRDVTASKTAPKVEPTKATYEELIRMANDWDNKVQVMVDGLRDEKTVQYHLKQLADALSRHDVGRSCESRAVLEDKTDTRKGR